MEDLIEFLKLGIKRSERYTDAPDSVSLENGEGVLLTQNEAKQLLEFLQGVKNMKTKK